MTKSLHSLVGPIILTPPSGTDWCKFAANILAAAFSRPNEERRERVVMLTGGRTAERVYQYWGEHPEMFPGTTSVRLLFGDERCVPPNHAESNFGMVERCWLSVVRRSGRIVNAIRMDGEVEDIAAAAHAYELTIPQVIDFVLLGMGEDGHIASLFAHDMALHERVRKVVATSSPKPPANRLTVTPAVLDAANTIFILATGVEKGRVLARAFDDLDDVTTLPVRLVLPRAILLLDAAAAQELAGIAKRRS